MKGSTAPRLAATLLLPVVLAVPRLGYTNCCQLSGSCSNSDDLASCQKKGGTFYRTRDCVGSTCQEITTPDRFGEAVAACDFNGDGFEDVAVGVPGEDVAANVDAGAVDVLYGSPGGVRTLSVQFLHEDGVDVEGFAEANDRFGTALAAGDFDGDGFCDLAVGVPGEDVGTLVDAGAVHVLYGSAAGLGAADDQIWDQNRAEGRVAVEGAAEPGDGFGGALAAGDFNGDGFADLAIGVPDEDVGVRVDAGAVNVLYGTGAGLSALNDQLWDQNSPNVNDFSETGDRFGSVLASADFNGDGFADLAIGVPEEDVGKIVDAGAVNVLYGTAARGLYTVNDQIWDQNKAGIDGIATTGERFGSSLAAGDFNGNGFADLAIGVPNENVGEVVDAGAVNVLYGGRNRLSYSGDQLWHRNTRDVEGDPMANERLGHALAVGDFDHDGFADLAIGIPGEDVDAIADAGAIQILYGSANRLTGAGDQIFTQNTPDVQDVSETGDHFGTALATGDFDGDGFADAVVGIPQEDARGVVDAGAIQILRGAPGNLSAGGNRNLEQGELIEGTPPTATSTTTTTSTSTTTTQPTPEPLDCSGASAQINFNDHLPDIPIPTPSGDDIAADDRTVEAGFSFDGTGLFTSRSRLLVTFNDEASDLDVCELLNAVNARVLGTVPSIDLVLLGLRDPSARFDFHALDAVVAGLREHPAVDHVVQDIMLGPARISVPTPAQDPTPAQTSGDVPPGQIPNPWRWNFPPSNGPSDRCTCAPNGANVADCGAGGICTAGLCTAGAANRTNCPNNAACNAGAGRVCSPGAGGTAGADGNWGLEAVRAPQMWNLNDYAFRQENDPNFEFTRTGVLDVGFNMVAPAQCTCAPNGPNAADCGPEGVCTAGVCTDGTANRVSCRANANCNAGVGRVCRPDPVARCSCAPDGVNVADCGAAGRCTAGFCTAGVANRTSCQADASCNVGAGRTCSVGTNRHPDPVAPGDLPGLRQYQFDLRAGGFLPGVGPRDAHGEHVAGIIGAAFLDGRGVDGINPFVERHLGPDLDDHFVGVTVRVIPVPSAEVDYGAFSAIVDDTERMLDNAAWDPFDVVNISLGSNWYRAKGFEDAACSCAPDGVNVADCGPLGRCTAGLCTRGAANRVNCQSAATCNGAAARVCTSVIVPPPNPNLGQAGRALRRALSIQDAMQRLGIAVREMAANHPSTLIVTAAGNDSISQIGPFSFNANGQQTPPAPGPVAVVSPRIDPYDAEIDARWNSPFAWAALGPEGNAVIGRRGKTRSPNVLVVEGLDAIRSAASPAAFPHRWQYTKSDSSNVGGHVAAPGGRILSTVGNNLGTATAPQNDYETFDGTSMATPQVTGLAGYLWTLDDSLTVAQVRTLLSHADYTRGTVRRAGEDNLPPGVAGDRPMIDAFAAALGIDIVKRTKLIHQALVDVDDGSLDGNAALDRDDENNDDDVNDERGMGHADNRRGDRKVNMRDFRAFRDAMLQVLRAEGVLAEAEVALDGDAGHFKRDLNFDGCVAGVRARPPHAGGVVPERTADTQCTAAGPPAIVSPAENVYPRYDFNGSGQIEPAGRLARPAHGDVARAPFKIDPDRECPGGPRPDGSGGPPAGCLRDIDVIGHPDVWQLDAERVSVTDTVETRTTCPSPPCWLPGRHLFADRNADNTIDYLRSADFHFLVEGPAEVDILVRSERVGGQNPVTVDRSMALTVARGKKERLVVTVPLYTRRVTVGVEALDPLEGEPQQIFFQTFTDVRLGQDCVIHPMRQNALRTQCGTATP
jgi:hypothetical protein